MLGDEKIEIMEKTQNKKKKKTIGKLKHGKLVTIIPYQ